MFSLKDNSGFIADLNEFARDLSEEMKKYLQSKGLKCFAAVDSFILVQEYKRVCLAQGTTCAR